MRSLFCFAAFACCAQIACAQTVIRGRVLDCSDHSGLPYANVGIEGRNVGTLSDASGNFVLSIADTLSRGDSITFSYVGFAAAKRSISDLDVSRDCSVELSRNEYEIPETVVRPGKTRRFKIGRSRFGSDLFSTSFFDKGTKSVGEENGVLLDSKYDCRVNRLGFFIKRNGFEKAKFRLTFYSVENGFPKESLVDKDIRFDVLDRYEGWFDLDLNAYDIFLKSGKFAVTLTLLEADASDVSARGFEMPITFLSRYSVIAREGVLGNWGGDKMMVAFFLDATVYAD